MLGAIGAITMHLEMSAASQALLLSFKFVRGSILWRHETDRRQIDDLSTAVNFFTSKKHGRVHKFVRSENRTQCAGPLTR